MYPLKRDLMSYLPHARESNTVLDSGFHAVDSRFHFTGFKILCPWKLDSGFLS